MIVSVSHVIPDKEHVTPDLIRGPFALHDTRTKMDSGSSPERQISGVDSGFGAWMHLMSWERMDARNDQARKDDLTMDINK